MMMNQNINLFTCQLLLMDFNQQITILQESIRMSHHSKRQTKHKCITCDRWRAIMARAIQRMKKKNIYDMNLLDDIATIVQSIKDSRFVQAILNIEPFRPNFLLKKRQNNQKKSKEHVENVEDYDHEKISTKLTNSNFQYRNSIIRLKQSVNDRFNQTTNENKQKHKKSLLQQMLHYVTEEETLTKQLETKTHPFKKIIQQYLFVVQNKYKNIIKHSQVVDIEEIQQNLIVDIKLLQQFIVKSSQPYITIFKTQNQDQKQEFQIKMVAFLKQYIEKHDKINSAIRKIMRMASRKTSTVKQLCLKVPDFVQINDFDIKEIYKIDGCYIQSMNAMMQFAEALNSKLTLKKLKEFRKCLSRDVDYYYANREDAPQHRQICSEMQIEIIKFILAKLKSFLGEIYAQLKFLEVVYGQSDMSFKYDDSSYMYAQISIALQALLIDYQ